MDKDKFFNGLFYTNLLLQLTVMSVRFLYSLIKEYKCYTKVHYKVCDTVLFLTELEGIVKIHIAHSV